ncbi:phosphatase PAP2 family protein [Piscinibacter terrae]|uniref:phosphatase PAP2 family protein n=1 Tax=Piscinibacter terrae TaxID=2496871 RepID=UPI0013874BDB|nr:phosphatase PAP2 family protein [Albitalea terrae]
MLLEERRQERLRLRQQRVQLWTCRERAAVLWLHRAVGIPSVLALFALVSRVGDGIAWYAVMASLPLTSGGWKVSLYMVALGAVNLVFYKALKLHTARPRPFVDCTDIRACARCLDEHSFPSGHTMHAVAFSMLLSHFYPAVEPLLWGFTTLVALSRVVLGLHYPSDVLAGAVIGVVTAGFFLVVV